MVEGVEVSRLLRLLRLQTRHGPCWQRVQIYAIRTKPCSFKGGNESPHRIFSATLAKDPTALRQSCVEENPKSGACTPYAT